MYDEQTEDLENPLRCPIKLYDYYLFKWQVTLCSSNLKNCVPTSESVSKNSSVHIWVFNTPVKTFLKMNSPFLSPALKASRDATMLTT